MTIVSCYATAKRKKHFQKSLLLYLSFATLHSYRKKCTLQWNHIENFDPFSCKQNYRSVISFVNKIFMGNIAHRTYQMFTCLLLTSLRRKVHNMYFQRECSFIHYCISFPCSFLYTFFSHTKNFFH